MRIVHLALKDLLQILHDRKSGIFLVLMPVLFTVIFGFAFSGNSADNRLPVGWINGDGGGTLAASLQGMLADSDAIRLIPLEGDDAARVDLQVRDGKLAAAVLVPDGFSARALAGEPLPLTLVAMPGLPAGQTAGAAVESAAKRLLGAQQAAHLALEAFVAQRPAADGPTRATFLQAALVAATASWEQPPLAIALQAAAGGTVRPDQVASGFLQSSPGMIVQFAVFSLVTSAMVLTLERKNRTLTRLLTTPIRRAEVIAGHMLAMFAIVLLQQVLLVGLGQFVFGVPYLHDPAGTLLLMVSLSLWAASLGLFVGALARKEEQVVLLSLVAMFVFSALGGAWFPLAIAGKAFSAVGHLLPSAWAMEGLQNIALRGLGLSSILLPAGILLGYAVTFFGLAVWRFRFE